MALQIQEINNTYDRIIGSLECRELKNAFELLQTLIAGIRAYEFQDRLDTLRETYLYMLRYRIEGAEDPMQEQIYNKLQISSYELADAVRQQALDKISPDIYYSQRRDSALRPAVSIDSYYDPIRFYSENGKTKEINFIQGELFRQIWITGFLDKENADAIRKLLCEEPISFIIKCQIISALFLGLQEFFDPKKLLLLFDAASRPDNEEIYIRALIAILITLYVYRKRIGLYLQIDERIAALAEISRFTPTLRIIILRFILTRETEKITRKLQDEIIPEMMKLSPKINRKINLKEMTPEQLNEEMNPEWEDLFANKQLGESIREFGELQQEGADIMHSTFIHLKHFPFFRELENWFIPFTTGHPALKEINKASNAPEKQMFDTLTGTGLMCDSDKYSLYFSMMQMPEETRRMMAGQFVAEVSEMLRQNQEEHIGKERQAEAIAGRYVQDLYRFFKLHPRHSDFPDIFTLPLDFHNLPVLRPYLSDRESLTVIGDYYLHKNYFEDALKVFGRLSESEPENAMLFQKIGYCKEMTGDYGDAIKAYLHADLLQTGSKWLTRQIAGCYRSLKQPEEALKYYRRYEAMMPDNLSVQISIGHCYIELKNYSEALKCFFKVDYLDSKSHKAWRPIAWCSFLTGKYDQARNYYKKIMENRPNEQDLLNAGHTEWALQNVGGALAYYGQAVKKMGGNVGQFIEMFNQDIPDLLIAGIEEPEVALMLDQLRYRLDGSL